MKRRILLASLLASAGALPASADVVISTAATQNMSCSGGVCAPTASDAVLNLTDLENLLASGNVSVVTTNGNVQANNIDTTAAFGWSSANGLTLDAFQTITFSAHVQVPTGGSVVLATNDGGSGGGLTFAIGKGSLDFASTKSPLSINGKTYKLAVNVKQLAKDIAAKPQGEFALSRDYDADKDGTYSSPPIPPFNGTFNGLGHAVSNLKLDDGSDYEVGFFAYLNYGGSISSILLRKARIYAGARAADVGALAGDNYGTIDNVSTSGSVRGGSTGGGAVGYNNGTIIAGQSTASVVVHGNSHSAGGLVGDQYDGEIALSFATGRVTAKYAGGLIGYMTGGTIENSYAFGAAKGGPYGGVGGIVGEVQSVSASISTSYSTGAVSGGTNAGVGGFDGYNFGSIATCYWDTETSGTDQGDGGGNETGLTGLTTAQFQSGLPSGFDPAIWAEDANINNGFPYLIANPPAK